MSLDPNIPASAVVLGAILIEHRIARRRGISVYALDDALSSIGTSLGQLALQAMLGFSTLTLYAWLYHTLHLIDIPTTSPVAWLLCWLLLELVLYWRHRAGHRLHLFWTIHEVHHQSAEYNLAVGTRIGYLQWLQTAVFVVPIAIVGVPPAMFAVLFGAIHLWQFLIHTQLVGRLGVLERVLMTPSHHRVHHGRNARYLDRNYGFTIVLFDHLFGTFQVEDERPLFGTRKGIRTWDPLSNNLSPWVHLVACMRAQPTLARALAVPFLPPGDSPALTSPAARTRHAGVAVALVAIATVLTLLLVQATTVWPLGLRLLAGVTVVVLTVAIASRSIREVSVTLAETVPGDRTHVASHWLPVFDVWAQDTVLPRVPRGLVHKGADENVFVSRVERIADDEFACQIVVDPHHPYFFEHPLDHVPGLALIEAGRQCGLCVAHGHYGVPTDGSMGFVIQDLAATFTAFAELDQPLFGHGVVTAVEYRRGMLHKMVYTGHYIQAGRSLGTLTGTWSILDARLLARLRRARPDR